MPPNLPVERAEQLDGLGQRLRQVVDRVPRHQLAARDEFEVVESYVCFVAVLERDRVPGANRFGKIGTRNLNRRSQLLHKVAYVIVHLVRVPVVVPLATMRDVIAPSIFEITELLRRLRIVSNVFVVLLS